MPRIAYLSETEEDFYKRLDHIMDIAARSLDTKRKVITKLLNEGLYPYTKRYLGTFENHFSTIGLIGMNEAGLNAKWIGLDMTHKETQEFTKNVLNHMRERLSDYQEKYGDLFNLEASPAESTTYRLAKHDVELYPDIKTATEGDGTPFYTNSSHLPVGYTEDVFSALDVQDELQTLYTSGTVFHAFLGEKLPDWKAAANLVRTIAENYKLPYYTLSPTYSICRNHGYITGEVYECPICGEKTEVYSRITGYYRPVQNWNDGKVQEFKQRKEYVVLGDLRPHARTEAPAPAPAAEAPVYAQPAETPVYVPAGFENPEVEKIFDEPSYEVPPVEEKVAEAVYETPVYTEPEEPEVKIYTPEPAAPVYTVPEEVKAEEPAVPVYTVPEEVKAEEPAAPVYTVPEEVKVEEPEPAAYAPAPEVKEEVPAGEFYYTVNLDEPEKKEEVPEEDVQYTFDVAPFVGSGDEPSKVVIENVPFAREEPAPAPVVEEPKAEPEKKGDAFAEFDALMASVSDGAPAAAKPDRRFLLFTTKTCPNCKIIKAYLAELGLPYEEVIAEENKDVARGYGIMQAPTAVILEGEQVTKYVGVQNIKNYIQTNLL